jgi:hypothetical protein
MPITTQMLAAAIGGFMIGIAISAAVVRCRQCDAYQSQRIRDLSAQLIEMCDRQITLEANAGAFVDDETLMIAKVLKTILESGARP